MPPIIHVKQVIKHYEFYRKEAGLSGTLKALVYRKKLFAEAVKGISFDIAEGEMVGFLGPNGAGKTTTLKMLSGILHPTSGDISVLGFTPHERKKAFKKQFGIVMGQKDQLIRQLPAMDSFLLFQAFCEIPDREFRATLDELATLLDVKDFLDVQVRKLSLGQRMKCELIGALLHKPKVLFLDEPTIGLDVVAQKNIRDFIKKYNREKKTTVILTSHYMDDIRALCDRVIIINFGTIIYDGKFEALVASYVHDKVIKVTFTEVVAKEKLAPFGIVEVFEDLQALVRVPREHVKRIAADMIASSLPIDDILIEEMPVDDIVRAIFKDVQG